MNLQQSIEHVCLGDPVLLSRRVPSRAALTDWAEQATMKRTMEFMRQAIRQLREKSPPILVVDNLRANLGLPPLCIEDVFLFDLPEHRGKGPLQVVMAKRRPVPDLPDLSKYKIVPFGPAFSIVDD